MKKLILLSLFVVLCFGPRAESSEKPLGVEELTSLEELALSLSSYFPKVQGDVKAVEGDRLTLSLGKKDGIIPGMMLTLWRDGKEILHPVTRAVIGRAEEEVGTAEVVSLEETSATAVIRKKQKAPAVGDKARITPRKINIALLPIKPDHPDVINSLAERLNELGRFNVLETSKVDAFVRNSKTMGTATIGQLGATFGLDAVISIGIYPSEEKLMTTARIFYTDDASQLDTVVAMLDLKPRKGPAGEIKPFFTPGGKEEKTISPELPFLAQSFATGDFDGDGKLEYAFADRNRIHLYRNEPSGWREVWTEVEAETVGTTFEWREHTAVAQTAVGVQHINIDAADINGNGTPELFITGMVKNRVLSWVVEYRDGVFQRIADIEGFVRVIDYPGKGALLLNQSYDQKLFYSGEPREYTWSDGRYVPGPAFPLPKGMGIYGWTYAAVGEPQPLLVALDEEDRLRVYSGEALVWKSADTYPVTEKYVYKPVTGIAAELSRTEQTDKSQRERLRGRVLAADMNGDGRDEIVVVPNKADGYLGGFSSAALGGFAWTGARLDPAWNAKAIPGPVLDFRFDRSGGVAMLVRTKGGLFKKERQQIMIYSVR